MMTWINQVRDSEKPAAGVAQLASLNAVTSKDSAVPEQAQFLSDQLAALRREHAALQQAIFEAAQVQRRLCAPRELIWRDYEVAGEIFPVRHLSGDFFKVIELGSALGIVVGDIAGKGFTAGIWQTHLMGLIQRAAGRHTDPADVVSEVNRELCRDSAEDRPIMALLYARIDRKNNLRYCNAGLPRPLLLRVDNDMEQLDRGGPMLGALKQAVFECGTVQLGPCDMLVAYSDGVSECRNREDQEFETRRLAGAARAIFGASASKALFSLLGTVLDFADHCSPADDLTLLVLRRDVTKEQRRSRDYSATHRQSAPVTRSRPLSGEGTVLNS
jgi:serine phosphatase RsbU (regulator of sigma subunit)